MTEIKTYNENGKTFEWARNLEIRKKSGHIGHFTVNIQLTGSELSTIQAQQKANGKEIWNSKEIAENAVLKIFGIVREIPKAQTDTTTEAKQYIHAINKSVLAKIQAGIVIDYALLEKAIVLKLQDKPKNVLAEVLEAVLPKTKKEEVTFDF